MFSRFEALGADFLAMTVGKSRPLEIGLLAAFNRRIIFGGANAIGITTNHTTRLFAD
jgi:hypothetical protein